MVANNLTSPVRLDGFAISSTTGLGGGRNCIGVRVRNCPQLVTVSNNTITAGNGTNGLSGAGKPAGASGANGSTADSFRGHVLIPASPTLAYWGDGGTSHAYYAGIIGTTIDAGEGIPGKSGSGALGGDRGAGGEFGNPGGNGGNGTPGGKGSAGTNGSAAAGIHLTGNFVSDPGGSGTPGFAGGTGGGGGGGGASSTIIS